MKNEISEVKHANFLGGVTDSRHILTKCAISLAPSYLQLTDQNNWTGCNENNVWVLCVSVPISFIWKYCTET